MHRLFSVILAAIALVYWACFAEPAHAQSRTAQAQLALDIYKELVEINTVTETGDTARAAEAMAARLRAAGLSQSEVQVFTPAPRKGNLVARLRGTGARKPILLLAHIDVVEARREDWERDPFTAVVENGYLFGRGSEDNKFGLVTSINAIFWLKKEGYKPKRNIVIVLSGDEETSQTTTAALAVCAMHARARPPSQERISRAPASLRESHRRPHGSRRLANCFCATPRRSCASESASRRP